MNYKKTVILIVLGLFLISCSSVSVSGRKQLLLVDEKAMNEKSVTEYTKTLRSSRVLNDGNAKLVKKVGNKIAKAVELYMQLHPEERTNNVPYQWEFNLIKDDRMVNAWCMPGGKVAVYTGILAYTQNEEGLAVVMAHEIAHAVAQHSREQASNSALVSLGGSILSLAGYDNLSTIYDVGTNLTMLSYSRGHENEADELGLVFMKLAGYNPEAAIAFWERMASAKSSGLSFEFLSTHPSGSNRAANIKRFLTSNTYKKAINQK